MLLGVKDKEAVIAALTDVGLQLMEQIAQCIALAFVNGIKPLIDSGARPAGRACGIVGAVVGYDNRRPAVPGDSIWEVRLPMSSPMTSSSSSCETITAYRCRFWATKIQGLRRLYQTIHQINQLIKIGRADTGGAPDTKLKHEISSSIPLSPIFTHLVTVVVPLSKLAFHLFSGVSY